MHASREFVLKKFMEFNALIFDNALDPLPIFMTESKHFLGLCVYKRKALPDGGFHYSDFKLRFNTRPDLPEREIEDVIIHEMVHYYILSHQIQDTSAHGRYFRELMQSINLRFGRKISVTHRFSEGDGAERMADTRRRWHLVALIDFSDGNSGLKVLPRVHKTASTYYNAFRNSTGVRRIELFMSDNPYFNRFPSSGALKSHICIRPEVEDALSGSYRAACDGQHISVDTSTRIHF